MATGNNAPAQSEMLIAMGGGIGALLLGGLLFYLSFCGEVAAPDRPPRPELLQVAAETAAASLDASARVYAQRLEDDARQFRLAKPVTVEDMGYALEHRLEIKRIEMSATKGRPVELAGLRIRALERDRMLALEIENLLDHPVAYRVDTRPDRGVRRCRGKDDWPHNAMALAAAGEKGSKVVRSECVYKSGSGLVLGRVETLELTALGYFYVSKLRPSSVALEDIALREHKAPEGELCSRTVSATLERQLRTGETTWRDMLDYYARHSCGAYRFPSHYKAVDEDGGIVLPVTE